MQIQLTITESFGDVVSFAEFARALQSFLAGRSHTVAVGSPASKAAATVADAGIAADVAKAEAGFVEASSEVAVQTEAPAKKRGRPVKAKEPEPVAEPDPFAEPATVAASEPAKPSAPAVSSVPLDYNGIRTKVLRFVELRPDRAAAAAEWATAMKADGYGSVAEITNDRVGETDAERAHRIGAIVLKLDGMIAAAEAAKAAAKGK